VPAYGPQNDVTLKMPAFEWVHVQLHQQKGMISLSPPTICNSAKFIPLNKLNKIDFERISDFESIDWRVGVIRNGGLYKRDWLKLKDNEKKELKSNRK
ncbi:hypothetical protein ABMZ76_18825, partial [Morganella morganii]|uniref:hypothetical protein n=1 Tax=Morganella morganii TaxID=582 RepID=UPI003EBE2D4C